MKFTLRNYQKRAVYDIVNHYHNYSKPGYVVIPTGGGKSLVIAEAIRQLGDLPTLVLQPSVELLKQNFAKYISQGGKASLYSASVDSKVVDHVTYATVGSIKSIPHKFRHIKMVLIDECHLHTNPGGMMDKFIKKLPKGVVIVGFTATPIRLKAYGGYQGNYSQLNMLHRLRPKFFSKCIHVTQLSELYDAGYLSPMRFTSYGFDRTGLKIKGSDFDQDSVEKELKRQGRTDFAIKLIEESLRRGKKRILVFTPTVGTSYYLKDHIPEIEVVSSETKKKDRERIVEDFREGRTRVVSNFGTLVVGFDVPEIDLIIMMRPTQSYAVYYQMCGRGIRIAPGKELCDLVDLSGNYKDFGDFQRLTVEEDPDVGWGLFVGNRVLTGIPVGTKVSRADFSVLEEEWLIGKYKGTKVKEIPGRYFEWVADNFDLTTDFSKAKVIPILKRLGIEYKK